MSVSKVRVFLIVVTTLIVAACSNGQSAKINESEGTPLPLTSEVLTGQLANGLKYYIRHNELPDDIVELRLNVRTGSLNETEEERGLAHFVEHMAFNGTRNFPQNGVIDFMESLGLTFGKHSNAYTSTNVTNYQLSVPLDKPELVGKSFLILRDWADGLTFDEQEIEKEKGVIVEEWRMRNDYRSRLRNQSRAYILAGSLYPEREPIGLMEVVREANKELLKGYYDKWYTAENMSVVVVGNIDVKETEKLIKSNFESMEKRNTPEKASTDVPLKKRFRFETISDKEAPNLSFTFDHLANHKKMKTYEDYKEHLLKQGVALMLNKRISRKKLAKETELYSFKAISSRVAESTEIFRFMTILKEDEYRKNLEEFFTEIERAERHGFSLEELEEFEKIFRQMIKRAARKDEVVESKRHARAIVNYDLYDEDFMEPEQELEVFEKVVAELNITSFNRKLKEILKTEDRLIMLTIPEAMLAKVELDKDKITSIMDKVKGSDIGKDASSSGRSTLMDKVEKSGKITAKERLEHIGVDLFTYENGAKLYVRPSEINKNKYQILAMRKGGTSILNDEDFIVATNLKNVIGTSGFKGISKIDISRILAGHKASVKTGMSEHYEYLLGGGDVEDMELVMQLLNLHLTSFDITEKSFDIALERMKKSIESSERNRFGMFIRRALPKLYNEKYRRGYLLEEDADKLKSEDFLRVYNEVLADVDGYVFVVAGDVNSEKTAQLFGRYIGTVKPSGKLKSKTKDIDRGQRFASKSGGYTEQGAADPKTTVIMRMESTVKDLDEDDGADLLASKIIRKKLREEVREKRGGVYSISGSMMLDMFIADRASGIVKFTCDPSRADELIESVKVILSEFADKGVTEEDLNTAKEQAKLMLDESAKKDKFWLNYIPFELLFGDELENIEQSKQRLDKVKVEHVNLFIRTFIKNRSQFLVRFEPEQNI